MSAMIGTKIYPRKRRTYFFLATYAILAFIGGVLAVQPVIRNQDPPAAAGFVLIFGAGMFVVTLLKSRRPQVSVFQDFLALDQTRTKQLVRYRNISSVSRPDRMRIVVTLREEGVKQDVTIWLKELDPAEVDALYDFLQNRRWKGN